jgi:transaldolase/glucose-6-phosphate isomerase
LNPLIELGRQGQSVWLDYIRRTLLTSGELERLIQDDGVTGVTVNPTILEKAIAGSDDYDEALGRILRKDPHANARQLYQELVVEDIQKGADILRPVYDRTAGDDGFISLELSPSLANDTEGTVAEARQLWELVDRPNLMIKVPATPEGIPAVETLISEGINVNITLMFSMAHYEAVVNAYLRGLRRSKDPARVASVASFFVSRVDKVVDEGLEGIGTPEALSLRGKIAIANSKMVYKRFREVFGGREWEELRSRGARPQKVLWASTGTKNPEYSDVLYVEELIGPETVNTLPPATMGAFKDHGKARQTLEEGIDQAAESLRSLSELGVDLDSFTEKLQVDGVASFAASYDKLLAVLEEKGKAVIHGQVDRQVLNLGEFQGAVESRLELWAKSHLGRRLWAKDPSLWSAEPVPELTDRLGWLVLPEISHDQIEILETFAEEVRADGIRHVVLLGMGGSSLAPDVYQKTFGNAAGYPELIVLDSSHPDAVRGVQARVELPHTLFIVASKSGTTLEPLALFKYFWEAVGELGDDPGHHFAAITDPGTPLEELAKERGFRRVFLAAPDLGGRYSALTSYGLVPAALIGTPVHRLLDRAWVAAEGCAFCISEKNTPGLALGATLGELALAGRDKVTFMTSPSLSSFPSWLEQLIAESTGKDGEGILPVEGEPATEPSEYADDRFFVHYRLRDEDDPDLEARAKALIEGGHPVATITLMEKEDIGMEVFRWEVAVASASSAIGVHPFNQPDVESAKDLARRQMARGGRADVGVDEVRGGNRKDFADALAAWLESGNPGDYIAIQAYLEPTEDTSKSLSGIRAGLLARSDLATTLGYGPRFLHSTGQFHKGGPNTGLFLQLVDEPEKDLGVPGEGYTFGGLISAQSVGDYQALRERGRRILRVNLGKDVVGGLALLEELAGAPTGSGG